MDAFGREAEWAGVPLRCLVSQVIHAESIWNQRLRVLGCAPRNARKRLAVHAAEDADGIGAGRHEGQAWRD